MARWAAEARAGVWSIFKPPPMPSPPHRHSDDGCVDERAEEILRPGRVVPIRGHRLNYDQTSIIRGNKFARYGPNSLGWHLHARPCQRGDKIWDMIGVQEYGADDAGQLRSQTDFPAGRLASLASHISHPNASPLSVNTVIG